MNEPNVTEQSQDAAAGCAPATGSAPVREYYILSLNHSPADGCALWWCPNDAGYTKNLLKAGKYSAAKVEEMAWYYNDGTATRAVACDAVEAAISLTVDWNIIKKQLKAQNEKGKR